MDVFFFIYIVHGGGREVPIGELNDCFAEAAAVRVSSDLSLLVARGPLMSDLLYCWPVQFQVL